MTTPSWSPFGAPSNWSWSIGTALPRPKRRARHSSIISRRSTIASGSTARWATSLRRLSNMPTTKPIAERRRRSAGTKQIAANNSLAAHLGGGRGSQGGAQQGTGARGEQYLDGLARSHTIAALKLFAPAAVLNTQIRPLETIKNTLSECPFFRSKPMGEGNRKEAGFGDGAGWGRRSRNGSCARR